MEATRNGRRCRTFQMGAEISNQEDTNTSRQSGWQAGRQSGRQANRETDRKIDSQLSDRPTDRETMIERDAELEGEEGVACADEIGYMLLGVDFCL